MDSPDFVQDKPNLPGFPKAEAQVAYLLYQAPVIKAGITKIVLVSAQAHRPHEMNLLLLINSQRRPAVGAVEASPDMQSPTPIGRSLQAQIAP